MTDTYHEVRCPRCEKLFFKDMGAEGKLEIKCGRCGTLFEVAMSEDGQPVFTVVSGPTHNPKQWWAAAQRRPGPEERK